MRGLGVTLVLLFLTGTQARHFWQHDEPPPSPLERFRQQFHHCLESAKNSAKEMVGQLDASYMGQRFNLDLATKAEVITAMTDQFRELMAPGAQAIVENLKQDFQLLTSDVGPIREKLQPIADKFYNELYAAGQTYYAKITPVVQEWRQSAQQDVAVLQSKVNPIAAEARDKVRALVADFRQKAQPYMSELDQAMRQKFQQAQERAMPRIEEIRGALQEQYGNLREAMAPLVEKVRERMGPALKELEDRLVGWITTIKSNLEEEEQQQQQQEQQKS